MKTAEYFTRVSTNIIPSTNGETLESSGVFTAGVHYYEGLGPAKESKRTRQTPIAVFRQTENGHFPKLLGYFGDKRLRFEESQVACCCHDHKDKTGRMTFFEIERGIVCVHFYANGKLRADVRGISLDHEWLATSRNHLVIPILLLCFSAPGVGFED